MKKKWLFDKITFRNRWLLPNYMRPSDWTIFGLGQWWSCYENMNYHFSFFGFDVIIWFKRR